RRRTSCKRSSAFTPYSPRISEMTRNRRIRTRLLGALVLGLTGSATSCATLTPQEHPAPPSETTRFSPQRVKLDGEGIRLGQPDRTTLSPEQLLTEVGRRLDGKRESARRMIRCYPDVALEALRTEFSTWAKSPALREIASAYDEQTGTAA